MAYKSSAKTFEFPEKSFEVGDLNYREPPIEAFSSKSSISDNDSVAFGKALFLLLNANAKAFQSAVEAPAGTQSPLVNALRSVESYIGNAEEPSQTGDVLEKYTEAMRQLLVLVKDKITKRRHDDPPTKSPPSALLLIEYLLTRSSHRQVLLELFAHEIKSGEKKVKLGIVQLLEQLISPIASSRSKSAKEKSVRGRLNPSDMVLLIPSLSECIRVDSALSSAGQKSPTRLTVAASDLLLTISYHVALADLSLDSSAGAAPKSKSLIVDLGTAEPELGGEEELRLIWNCISSLRAFVQEVAEWRRGQHPTMEAALREVSEFLVVVENHMSRTDVPDRVLMITVCYNWVEWANALLSENYELSSARFRKRIREVLDEIDRSPSHPYKQLVAIALLLGHRDPTLSVADVFEPSKADREKKKKEENDFVTKLHMLTSSFMKPSAQIRGQTLAIFLFRRLLVSELDSRPYSASDSAHQLLGSSHSDSLRPLLDPLLEMLESDDELPSQIIGMVAECAIAFPAEVLGIVFTKLESKKVGSRRTGLSILQEIVRMSEGIFREGPGGTQAVEMSKLIDALEGHLLDRLHDDDIQLRSITSWLFTNLDTARIIPRLACRLTERDARVRSAAETALVENLLNRSGVNGLLDFVEFIRDIQANPRLAEAQNPSPAPANPGQIYNSRNTSDVGISASDSGPASPKPNVDGLFRIVSKWAEKVDIVHLTPPQSWPLLVPNLITKTYASPADQTLIRLWSTVSIHLGQSRAGVQSTVERCVGIMETQARLAEEDVNTDNNEDVLQGLLFARLSPLLVLKTLPSKAFDECLNVSHEQILGTGDLWDSEWENSSNYDDQNGELGLRMLRQIMQRCSRPVEFPQIRQLGLSLLPHLYFHASLPLIYRQLTIYIGAYPRDLVSIKGLMFSFASWVLEIAQRAGDGISPSTWDGIVSESEVLCIERVFDEGLAGVFAWRDGGDELHKVQLGAIDTISLILTTGARAAFSLITSTAESTINRTRSRPLIEEIGVSNPTSSSSSTPISEVHPIAMLFSKILAFVLAGLHPPSANHPKHTSLMALVDPVTFDSQLPICMANVLVMTAKRLGGQPLAGGTDGSSSTRDTTLNSIVNMDLFASFVDAVGVRILDVVNRVLAEEGGALGIESSLGNLAAACFQVLFHVAFTFRAEPERIQRQFLADLMDTSINGLGSPNIEARIGALKLLTILLSMTSANAELKISLDLADALTPSKVAKIMSGLEELQSAAASGHRQITREVIALVEQILKILRD